MNAMVQFFKFIYLVRVQGLRIDSLQWKGDRKGKFCEKPFHSSLCDGSREMFTAKEIWRPHALL